MGQATTGTAALTSGPADDGADAHALPVGTRLNEFELTQRIGEGGFSIVYLAWDHSLDRRVALKEYMPGALASRVGATQIRPRSERHRETFEAGLKSFVNEAKLLARFDHPALVKVYRFWEANGTAYLVMPLYEGATLKETVRVMTQPPDEAWLMALLGPLTAALAVIHGEQCYHRDIAPDNVMMLADGGKPLLLDFGAARRVIGDLTQALTVILKPGFAPIEQYAEVPGMKQGPWTDVYALAATVYWVVMGKTPPASVGRMLSDCYVPLAQAAAGRYSTGFLQAIDRALVVLPERRTQTVAALRRDLGIDADVATDVPPTPDPEATVIFRVEPRPAREHPQQTSPPRTTEPAARPALVAANRAAGSRRALLILGALSIIGVAVGGLTWWSSRPAPEPSAQTPVAPKPATNAPVQSPPALAVKPEASKTEATASNPSTATAGDKLETLEPPARPPAEGVTVPPPRVGTESPILTDARRPAKRDARTEVKSVARSPGVASAAQPVRSAECAQIFQRLSLGETQADLLERAKALNCR